MNKMKRIGAIFFAVLMLCSVALFSACGGGSEAEYKVSVVDGLGNPYTEGVVVKFMQNGTQAGMQIVDANGVATKTLAKGDYTVELQFTDSDVSYTYDAQNAKLSASQTELKLVVNNMLGEKNQPLSAGEGEYTAYFVEHGCTEITLNNADMSYYLFAPTKAGVFQFSLLGSDATIGYYGMPHFVRHDAATEIVDNTFKLSIEEGMVNSAIMVIGVGKGEGKAVLTIQEVAKEDNANQELAWSTDWEVGHEKSENCKVTVKGAPKYFDIKAKTGAYDIVYDEAVGYYRLGQGGPAILVMLGQNTNPDVQCAGLYEMINGNGVYGGSNISRYFKDDSGKIVKKEKYTDYLLTTFAEVGISAYNEDAYHPLTKDLMYILQNGLADWWNSASPNYQESFTGANPDYAWLFACCYFQ